MYGILPLNLCTVSHLSSLCSSSFFQEGILNSEDGIEVTRINLKDEYMKIQRKKVEGSQQRIENGIVYFTVFSVMQILNVRTFVQRLSDWLDDFRLNRPENSKYICRPTQLGFSTQSFQLLTLCHFQVGLSCTQKW